MHVADAGSFADVIIGAEIYFQSFHIIGVFFGVVGQKRFQNTLCQRENFGIIVKDRRYFLQDRELKTASFYQTVRI